MIISCMARYQCVVVVLYKKAINDESKIIIKIMLLKNFINKYLPTGLLGRICALLSNFAIVLQKGL